MLLRHSYARMSVRVLMTIRFSTLVHYFVPAAAARHPPRSREEVCYKHCSGAARQRCVEREARCLARSQTAGLRLMRENILNRHHTGLRFRPDVCMYPAIGTTIHPRLYGTYTECASISQRIRRNQWRKEYQNQPKGVLDVDRH